MKHFVLFYLLFAFLSTPVQAKTIKVLAIGNSFSEDAVEQYLYQLAKAQGDSLVIGNAFIAGCSIHSHYRNLVHNAPGYSYRKIIGGEKNITKKIALKQIIQDEPWDIISLQQASPFSGKKDSYTDLPELTRQVLALANNKSVEIVWHMTWSYPQRAKTKAFEKYGYNQQVMYDSIVSAMLQALPLAGIERYIPVGLAVQSARGNLGDVLNRDDLHLTVSMGRFLAGCVWCEFLTRKNITKNPMTLDGISKKDLSTLKHVAHNSIGSAKHNRLFVKDKK